MPTPNLFLLGAPKCGTTSIARWLSDRNDIFLPNSKEQHFFDSDHNNSSINSLGDYLHSYSTAQTDMAYYLDGSVWYLYSHVAVPQLLNFCPDAKMIVLLRNPVEMAYSLHDQMIFSEFENEQDFEKAWDLQDSRSIGHNIPRRCQEPKFLQYRQACSLGHQVERLFRHCSRDRVHLVFTEDMKANPRQVYLQLLSFLGLEDDGRTEFPLENIARKVYSTILRRGVELGSALKRKLRINSEFGMLNFLVHFNSVNRERPALDPAVRYRLIQEFREDIDLLQQITGRDLSAWR